MKIQIALVVTIILLVNKANCGVIEGVYDKVADTTQAVKDDVYSWWTYGLDTMLGENHTGDAANNQTKAEEGIFGRVYNKVKGGVSAGYMKIHDLVLGKDSDPNKGIIKTLYERAIKKLSAVMSFVLGEPCPDNKPESQANNEAVNEQVIKLLFQNTSDLFNTENERRALETLRQKLTQTGEDVTSLTLDEKEIIRKAYNTVRQKSDEFLYKAKETEDNLRNKLNENIGKAQEFIHDASDKVNESAQNVGQEVKKVADGIESKVQSE